MDQTKNRNRTAPPHRKQKIYRSPVSDEGEISGVFPVIEFRVFLEHNGTPKQTFPYFTTKDKQLLDKG